MKRLSTLTKILLTLGLSVCTITPAIQPVSTQAAVTRYTLSFDLNGGTGSISDIQVPHGTYPFDSINYPTRPGYYFAGWCLNADGTNPIKTTFRMTEDTTVYANWAKDPKDACIISLNLNGGYGLAVHGKAVNYGGYAGLSSVGTPFKSGHEFTGWYFDEDCTNPITEFTKIFDHTTAYAGWAPTYTLSFNLNGGSGIFPSQVIVKGGNPVEPTHIPTKDGYNFVGWYVNSRLTIPMNFSTWEMNHSGSVFAKWELAK